MNNLWKILLLPAAICTLYLHDAAAAGLLEAGRRCVYVIVPSLYLFTMLAVLAGDAGVLTALRGRGGFLAMLFFSQIGGYPVGAQLVMAQREMLDDGLRHWMLCICFGSGPAFLLGTVCRGLKPVPTAVMMLSVMLPNLLMGGILILRAKADGLRRKRTEAGFAQLLTESAEKASAAMLKICGMVLLFGAVTGMLRESGVLGMLARLTADATGGSNGTAEAFLSALLDVSAAGEYLQQGGSLPAAAALLSFGGICVHLQIASLTDGMLPWGRFFLCRLLSAGGTWLLCTAGLRLFCHGEVSAVLLVPDYAPRLVSGNPAAVLCLLVMSVMLLMRCPSSGMKSMQRFENNPMKFLKIVDKN